MIVVIDKKSTQLQYKSGSLLIIREKQHTQRIPLSQLELLIIYGNALAETNVWRYLSQANIAVVLLPSRGAQGSTLLGGSLATQLPFRRLQHQTANHAEQALQQARYFLDLKCQSYQLSVTTLCHFYHVAEDNKKGFITQQQNTLSKIPKASTLAQLMGLEGQLAQAWFALLAKSLPYRWKFAGRNRRPPRDPVNSLLSLSYTLLMGEAHQLVIASGLDPSLGFLHQDAPGRESLVLDFMEIFRAAADSFVLQWLAETDLDDSSFYFREKQGCRLSKSTRPLYFGAWAHYREQWRRSITNETTTFSNWPQAPLREQITGHIMNWRENLKHEETP